MRIRHVIPTVGDSAPDELVEAQRLTLLSIHTALRCVGENIDVEVRAVHFPDEPLDCDWVTDCPILARSILDIGEFEVPRRLPLLHDVLAGLGDSSDYDVAIFTNVDIALQPMFYELIAEIHDEGYDVASITRRTVQPRFRGSSLARFSTADSTAHPGHDCFSMNSEIVDSLEPCDVALGTRWVARALTWQAQLAAKKFRNFADLHATFHVGDDRSWVDPRFADYERHNESAAQGLIERLIARYGREPVARLQSTIPFVEAIEAGTEVRTPKANSMTVPYGAPAQHSLTPRLLFSANTGRAGSNYLAWLLNAAPRVEAEHERPPEMVGSWARRVAFEPLSASYSDRLVKADAIRAELNRIPAWWVYADTNHMFIKTFADVVFDEFQHEQIAVAVLRRDPVDVAMSFFMLNYFGPAPHEWYNWMNPPTGPQSKFLLKPEDVTDQFDLIFGYLADIENRTEHFRRLTPAVSWHDLRLEEITSPDGAADMFQRLGITAPRDLGKLVTERRNTKDHQKAAEAQPVSRCRVQERLSQFLDRHRGRTDLDAFIQSNRLDEL